MLACGAYCGRLGPARPVLRSLRHPSRSISTTASRPDCVSNILDAFTRPIRPPNADFRPVSARRKHAPPDEREDGQTNDIVLRFRPQSKHVRAYSPHITRMCRSRSPFRHDSTLAQTKIRRHCWRLWGLRRVLLRVLTVSLHPMDPIDHARCAQTSLMSRHRAPGPLTGQFVT